MANIFDQFDAPKRPAPPDVNADPRMAIATSPIDQGINLPHDPEAPGLRNISGSSSDIRRNVFDQFDPIEIPHDHPAQYDWDRAAREAKQTMKTGVGQLQGPGAWNKLKGAGNVGLGAVDYAFSPLTSGIDRNVGDPITRATGSPTAGGIANMVAGAALPAPFGMAGAPSKPNIPLPTGLTHTPELGAPSRGAVQSGARQAAPTLEPDIRAIVAKNYGPQAAQIVEAKSLGAAAAPPTRPPPIAPASGERLKSLFMQQYGLGRREANKVGADFEQHYRAVNKSTSGEIWNLIDAAQGQAPAESVKKELRPVYDAFRTVAKGSEDEFRKVYATAGMDFQKMYFPQAYKNDPALQRFLGYDPENMPGGVGQAWMTKKKQAFPTWRDARAAGLSPKYDNPIDMFKVYTNNVQDFLSAHRVKEAMQEAGTLKYPKKGIGGRPEVPEGWAPLTHGPFTHNAGGVQAYAPKELAGIWDTKFSRPIQFKNPRAQSLWESTEAAFNRNRSFKFLISGYHATNMTKEAGTSAMGSAIDNLMMGKPIKTMRDLQSVIPYKTFQEGRRGRGIYSSLIKGDERSEQIINAIAQANPSIGRVFGTPELGGSVHESIPQFLDRHGGWKTGGAYKDMYRSVAAQLRGVRDAFAENGPFDMKTAWDARKPFLEAYDKATDLTSAWLFKHYIPDLKMGLMMRDVGDFMEAKPLATNDEIVFAAQKASRFADDIMGEYMKDNLFWPKAMHQILDKVFLAPTYLYGTLRAFGKGGAGLAQQPGRLLGMADQVPSFNKASPRYEPAMGYTLGLIATTAIGNALYQKVKTGIWPEDIWDVLAPRTGGTTEIGGGAHQKKVPERLGPIGNIKEWYDWYKDFGYAGGKAEPLSYADPKLNPLLSLGIGLGRMKDWRGDPIVTGDKGTTAPGDIARYIWSQEQPISVSQGLFHPAQAGTGLSLMERLMGLRAGAMQLSDPKGYRGMMDKKAADAEKAGRRHRQSAEHHARNEDEVP